MASSVDESTPASRASALSAPRAAVPDLGGDDDTETAKRHPLRAAVLLLVLLALIAGGLGWGWHYTQTQYYVGATKNGTVAVFQGVPGQIAGLHLSRVHETSSTRLSDLTTVAQDRVRQGIPAKSESDARRTLAEITDPTSGNVLPTCGVSSSAPSVSGFQPTPKASGPTPNVPATTPTPSTSPSPIGASPTNCR